MSLAVVTRRLKSFQFIVLVGGALFTDFAWGSALSDFAYSKDWLKALHYEERSFGRQISIIDDPDFFLSGVGGKKDPLLELQATIQAFKEDRKPWGKLGESVRCSFPFRERLISEHLGIVFGKKTCKDFEEWRTGIAAKSVTLVFSSHYPNNPASLFGHTFLRFNRKENPGESNDLLSYAANFSAATSSDDSQFVYILKGLLGGYPGRFSFAPYYMKVNEYNYAENRDLWEFDLNFTAREVELFLEHLWEMYGQASAKYFFLDENCSYQILAMFEAVKPSLELVNRFHVYAIPLETVQVALSTPGFLKSHRYRPALRKRMFARYDTLSDTEKNLRTIDAKTSTAALEFLQTKLLFFKTKQKGVLTEDQKKLQTEVLLERSKRSETVQEPIIESGPPIFEAHYTSQLRFSALSQNGEFKQRYTFSGFRHDLVSRNTGFDPFSALEIFTFDFSKSTHGKDLQMERARIIAMTALRPIEPIDYRSSWELNFDYVRPLASTQSYVLGHVAYGAGVHFFRQKNIFNVLGDVETLQGVERPYSHEFLFGLKALATGELFRDLRYKIDLVKNWNAFHRGSLGGAKIGAEGELGYTFSRGLEFRALSAWSSRQDLPIDRKVEAAIAVLF